MTCINKVSQKYPYYKGSKKIWKFPENYLFL